MRKVVLALASFIVLSLHGQNWTQVADLPGGVHHPVTWGIDSFGYAATGTNTSNLPTSTFYRYNPQADNWTSLNSFPGTPRSFAIGVAYEGEGYLGFGATRFNYLNDLWKYNPQSDNWTQLASCPCAGRRHPSFVAVNDAIYMGLGDGRTGDLKDWWKYDMTTDSWTQLPDLPGPARHHPYQFTVDGDVYAGMGHSGNFIYADWYRLDTDTDTWQAMSDFPDEARVAGTQFNHANKGYVLSGDGDNHSTMPTGEFWEYDFSSDSWTELTPHPGRSRWAPGSFILKDEVYVLGGLERLSDNLTTAVYKYPLPSTVNIAETQLESFSLYPNPAEDLVLIRSSKKFDALQVLDLTGKVVLKTASTGSLSVSELSAGIYYLQLLAGDELLGRQKLMVQ